MATTPLIPEPPELYEDEMPSPREAKWMAAVGELFAAATKRLERGRSITPESRLGRRMVALERRLRGMGYSL